MKKISIKNIKTKAEAQQIAIAWQHWQSTQVLSYMNCIEWAIYFEKLAKKFNLVEEFKENAIF